MSSRRARPGFTLMEVLVAAGLIGVVMAMAMQAFMGLTKISETARSKMIASSEAGKGVHAVAALLRRAHVIYFTGKPLNPNSFNDAAAAAPPTNWGNDYNPTDGIGINDPSTLAVPQFLSGLSADAAARGPNIPYNFQTPTAALGTGLVETHPRGFYRFYDWGTSNGASTMTGARRFGTSELPPASNLAYDNFFTSPLLYIGEANLATDRTTTTGNGAGADGSIGNMFMPVSWTFHIIYLSPMDMTQAIANNQHPSYVPTGRPADRGPGGWVRSTIPFELRDLMVSGVDADTNAALLSTHRSFTRGTAPNIVREYLDAPFDYPPNGCNYDPIGISFTAGEPAGIQNATTARNGTTYLSAGGRVRGPGTPLPHSNYNNIGNDPPSQEVFNTFLPAPNRRISDRVLASYVDPDAIHGTCVRLLNTIGQSPALTSTQETAHPMAGGKGLYRRYLNAYGGEFLYNHYRGNLTTFTGWNIAQGAGIPRRALISVTTRYRSDSRVPFQFSSEQVELELDNLYRFQTINRRSR